LDLGFGLGSQSDLNFWTSRDFSSLSVGLEIRASVGLRIWTFGLPVWTLVQIGLSPNWTLDRSPGRDFSDLSPRGGDSLRIWTFGFIWALEWSPNCRLVQTVDLDFRIHLDSGFGLGNEVQIAGEELRPILIFWTWGLDLAPSPIWTFGLLGDLSSFGVGLQTGADC